MQPCFLLSEVQHVNPIDRSVRGISFKDAAVITISKAQPDGIRWRVAGLALRSLLGKLGLQRWQPISPLVSVTTTVRCGAASGLWRTPHWLTSEWGVFLHARVIGVAYLRRIVTCLHPPRLSMNHLILGQPH